MLSVALEETIAYEDFRIELRYDPNRNTFDLRARSQAGETMVTDFHCPYDFREIEEALAGITRSNAQFTRSIQRVAVDTVKVLGSKLFASISENRVGDLYQQSSAMAKDKGRNLRLRFVLDHVWMAALPWEFLFDTTRLDFLTLSTRSPVVRQWSNAKPPATVPASIEPPLRMLVAIAEVNKWDEGTAAQEVEVLKGFEKSTEIEVLPDATPLKLLAALKSNSFHVLHLIMSGAQLGTGDGTSWGDNPSAAFTAPPLHTLLMLSDTSTGSTYNAQSVEMSHWFEVISQTQKELQLINFSGDLTDWLACQTTEISPSTLGWRGHNTVEAYLSFTKGFYGALADGLPLEVAVTYGRKEIDANYPGGKEWGMPVFYMQNENSPVLRQPKRVHEITSSGRNVIKRKGKAPQDPHSEREWRKLQVLMASAEENYQALQQEVSKFTGQAVPEYLELQMTEVVEKISGLKSQLKRLSK